MKECIVRALAVFLLIVVPATALGGESADPAGEKGNPPAFSAPASCRIIAAILGVYPNLAVRTLEGPVLDLLGTFEQPACRVHAAGPARVLVGEVPPARALRELLGQLGWEEDPRLIPGDWSDTSFLLRKESVLCLFTGDALSGTEFVTAFRKETYELEAMCAAKRDR